MLLSSAAVISVAGLRLTDSAATLVLAASPINAPLRPSPGAVVSLEAAERMTALPCFEGKSLPLWTFDATSVCPIIRIKRGQELAVAIKNSLPRADEHITLHWHGLRIPNTQDGVAYMTQAPIMPGETGRYAFTPPETGTFFFHTHCNSVDHFGRGLVGALIVEGDEAQASDADLVLMMKDWRLDAGKAFLPFTTDEGAAKAGTAGTVRAINGVTNPVYAVPASGNIRVRLLNVDPVRISEIGVEGTDAAIIAVDGNGCAPIELGTWRLGPAGRLDILMRAPKSGQVAQLVDYFSAEPVVLAQLVGDGPEVRDDAFTPTPLLTMPFKVADRRAAEQLDFTFSATATGSAIAAAAVGGEALLIGKLCLSKRTFWAINKQPWSSVDHSDLGPPLASLKLDRSYIFELKNVTPNAHPIHIHGHTFEIIKSNLRDLPSVRADTILLLPKERIEVALVADNPGRWMFHCHILEHQETGMMGYVTVT